MTNYDTGMEAYPELISDDNDIGLHDPRPVVSQPNDWTISSLRDKYERGQIDLQPAYQREYVWSLKPELPSRLIESLLLEIPIPPLYFGKLPGGRLDVIDGQQRLTTLMRFVRNEFPLQKLQRLTQLTGKYFQDLSDDDQARITDSAIRSIIVDTGSNQNLRYEVFERLNRGSMALNEQELRNCVYRGPFADLLAELERDPAWRRVRGTPAPEPRFVEREMILRFFAFTNRIEYYAGNLKRFLIEYMERHAPRTPPAVEEHATLFRQTMQNLYTVFGDKAGRLYSAAREDQRTRDGRWEPKFSVSALDIQASALLGQPTAKVQAAADQIREAYLLYLLTNPTVRLAISRQPAGTAATRTRWFGFKGEIQQLMQSTRQEPRFFPYELRRDLYEESSICRICHNPIHSFEDATVDHIIPYSRGGKTIPTNAQLAHRSCNARKWARVTEEDEDEPLEETWLDSTPAGRVAPWQIGADRSNGSAKAGTPGLDTRGVDNDGSSALHTLDEDFQHQVPRRLILGKHRYDVQDWYQVYQTVCFTLAERDPGLFEQLPTQFSSSRRTRFFSTNPAELTRPVEITDQVYVELALSPNFIRDSIKRLLAMFELPQSFFSVDWENDRIA
jgi:hypothetical protein